MSTRAPVDLKYFPTLKDGWCWHRSLTQEDTIYLVYNHSVRGFVKQPFMAEAHLMAKTSEDPDGKLGEWWDLPDAARALAYNLDALRSLTRPLDPAPDPAKVAEAKRAVEKQDTLTKLREAVAKLRAEGWGGDVIDGAVRAFGVHPGELDESPEVEKSPVPNDTPPVAAKPTYVINVYLDRTNGQ